MQQSREVLRVVPILMEKRGISYMNAVNWRDPAEKARAYADLQKLPRKEQKLVMVYLRYRHRKQQQQQQQRSAAGS